MTYCRDCGQPVHGRFCGHCGGPAVDDSGSVQELYQVGPGGWQQPDPDAPGYPEQSYPGEGHPEQGHHPEAPPPEPPRRSGLAAGVIAGLAAVAILAVAGLVGYLWFSGRPGTDEATARASSASGQLDGPGRSDGPGQSDRSGGGSADSTPQADLSPAQALARLEGERSRSLQGLSLDGRWVLQLSSKYPGVEDSDQVAPVSGGHVFHAQDIWVDYQSRASYAQDRGMPVRLVKGGDFGKSSSPRKHEMFVVLADPGGMTSQGQADARCAGLYPGTSGSALDNLCLPRRLNPPS